MIKAAPRTSHPIGDAATGLAEVAEVAESVRLSVTRLARILRQQDGSDLTPSATSALAMVHHHGPLTLGELATREHVSAPTVTRIVDALQRAGLVRRTASPNDGRVVFVSVTDKGKRLVLDARRRRTQWLVEHLATLSPEDVAALQHAAPVLERLVAGATESQP
ncbi:MAG: MarR family transcriptional regulator [Actinomycetota bacterium]|nr:MarR family transcriptional regulator [Actinomycetota bacterium]